ncbi:MAG: response regulator [Candidatus Eremiobacteraeota bacterium]|nr:response regulator [Candidatus Eremiobacteraeota bacterium]
MDKLVYLLEDSDADVLAFLRALKKISPGTRLVRWRTLQQALEYLAARGQEVPVAMFLDLYLPDGGGLDLLRRISDFPSPIFLISSLASAELREIAIEAGALGLVDKDQSFADFAAALQQALTG